MTINDIKKDALRLMFANYSDDISTENIDETTNEEYLQYTVNMNASINRALGRMQAADVLPDRQVEVSFAEGAMPLMRIDMMSLDPQYLSATKVSLLERDRYRDNVDFIADINSIILPKLTVGSKYLINYKWAPTRVSDTAPSSTKIDIPDYLAEIIPYFIKSELYEEDEPQLAIQARNAFEAMLEAFALKQYHTQNAVVNVFGGLI